MASSAVVPGSILVGDRSSALSQFDDDETELPRHVGRPLDCIVVDAVAPQSSLILHDTMVTRALNEPRATDTPFERRACQQEPAPWPSGEAVAQEARAAWFENPEYQRYLDALTHSEALSGNYTNILINGPESYAHREENIRNADVVMAKYYQVDDDETSQRIVEEMRCTAARGGKVFFQFDTKVAFNAFQLFLIWAGLKSPIPPVLEPLNGQPNVSLIPNNRPRKLHNLVTTRDHEKYLITWREGHPVVLLLGGQNISNAWAHGGDPYPDKCLEIQYRDTDVEIVGPTAERAIKEFVADVAQNDPDKIYDALDVFARLNKAQQEVLYPSSDENAVVRFVTNRPRNGDCGQFIKKLYISLLEQVPAGESVHIENAYLLPRGSLKKAIIAAADRGVKVKMVVNAPDAPEYESRLLGSASHAMFRRMLDRCRNPENLKFYEYRGNPALGVNCMHQKVASFGKTGPYIIGSSNLDEQSLHFNKEVIALIYDAKGRKAFDEMWRRDVKNLYTDANGNRIATTFELTHDFLRNEPVGVRAKQDALYKLFSRVL